VSGAENFAAARVRIDELGVELARVAALGDIDEIRRLGSAMDSERTAIRGLRCWWRTCTVALGVHSVSKPGPG
jgi:hypothetical protein